jgi:hypothetical protein
LDLAAAAYKNQESKSVDLGSCWDRFFEIEKNAMVKFGKDFVLKGIQDLAARWVEDPSKDDEYQATAQKVKQVLAVLGEKVSQIYMLDLVSDYIPEWE